MPELLQVLGAKWYREMHSSPGKSLKFPKYPSLEPRDDYELQGSVGTTSSVSPSRLEASTVYACEASIVDSGKGYFVGFG